MVSAVIYTAGRTGSHLIETNLSSYFKSPMRNWWKCEYEHGIVHAHNPFYIPPNNTFICIISKRKNEFSAILSLILTRTTAEFIEYTSKHIDSINISEDEFTNTYRYYKAYYQLVDTAKYDTMVLYYEDIIDDPKYLFSKFGVDKVMVPIHQKSPYDYYKLIENVNALKILYDEYEKTPLSSEIIQQVKASIEQDLLEIRTKYNGNKPI